jgi:hypothetical protein
LKIGNMQRYGTMAAARSASLPNRIHRFPFLIVLR